MSSCHLLLGRPHYLFPLFGCHSMQRLVHLVSFHYGPKMYLRVSKTQSHLFPGQPLRCTRVIALCTRVPSWVQPVVAWVQVTNASIKSLVHYCFVAWWPKCSLKHAKGFLSDHLEQTDTKFKYSLELGEGLRAGTVSRESERSCNITICLIFIIWHISIAYCKPCDLLQCYNSPCSMYLFICWTYWSLFPMVLLQHTCTI